MKVIINETNNNSTIVIDGDIYSVDAKSKSEPVSESVAKHWKKIHGFLIISDVAETPVKKIETQEKEVKTSTEKIKKTK